ncbi:Elp5 [Acrasis kona]|uniref:Elongator complex protein 5 n=1 Tax=Acrasis kona TaxID=1008807 RepID=A0AAW2Z4Q2_9EUKA
MNQVTAILNNISHYRYALIEDDINTRFYTPYILKKLYLVHSASMYSTEPDSLETFEKQLLEDGNNVVVIDVSSLIWRFGLEDVTKIIHNLVQQKCVVCILHTDVHNPDDIAQLKTFATATIKLIEVGDKQVHIDGEEKVLDQSAVHFGCQVKSIRSNSKLLSGTEYFKIIDNRECIMSFVKDPYVSIKKDIETDRPMTTNEIDKQVPFKISMTEQDKKSRDHAIAAKQPKKGFIIVDEDEGDDSDPDDDLDI